MIPRVERTQSIMDRKPRPTARKQKKKQTGFAEILAKEMTRLHDKILFDNCPDGVLE